jgi:ribosomal-protein-alanine N-acetyltransferase
MPASVGAERMVEPRSAPTSQAGTWFGPGPSFRVPATVDCGVTFERVANTRLITGRLELRPLPAAAARALPDDREAASRILDATLAPNWPQPDLLDVLPLQAAAAPSDECFGVWVMIERETASVVGDIGFIGLPDDSGSVEVGYSVITDRRRRGYATEAARVIVDWALDQPGVSVVVAGCDKDNVPSIRTLEHIGFLQTEEADGQIRWRYGSQSEQG